MSQTAHTRGLTPGSLFKFLFIGSLCSLGILIILLGIGAWSGMETIYLNEVPVVGFKGFVVSLILVPIVALVYAFINWLILISGVWIWTRFRKLDLKFLQ